MWIVIFLLVIAAAAASGIYLVRKVSLLWLMKWAADKKAVKWAASAGVVLLVCAALVLTLDAYNAVVSVLHLVLIWLICDLVCLSVRKLTGREISVNISAAGAVVLTAAVLCFGWYSAHHVAVTEYRIKTDKNPGQLKAVWFADSHVGTTFHSDGFAKYIDEINSENPDVVLIVGDFVDDGTTREDMLECSRLLSELKTKYGVYFVFGNHDKGYSSASSRGWTEDELRAELVKSNVNILEDETVLIDDRFYITGRQDRSEYQHSGNERAEMSELAEKLDSDKFMIVMDHQPGDYEAQRKAGADLVLSGHTHGGQLIPITYVGEWIGVNDNTYGYEKHDGSQYIVTSGISDWAIKFKTGCRSEYVVTYIE